MALEAYLAVGTALRAGGIALLAVTFVIQVLVPVTVAKVYVTGRVENGDELALPLDVFEIIDEAFHRVHQP